MKLLDDVEVKSSVWLKFKKYAEERIESLHGSNEASLNLQATDKIRGRISELKRLLNAVEPKQYKVSSASEGYTLEDKLNERRKR